MNQTIFQFFHWYYSTEGNLWQHAAQEAKRLASLGITQVWLPPAYKSALGADEPGYAVYDLYDLGEFDQKGSVRTRYGTKDEYIQAINAFHDAGIKVIADIVLNHRMGGDEKEQVLVMSVDNEDRQQITSEPHTVELFTKFYFPGRNNKYSDFIWDKNCFTGACESDEIKIFVNDYTKGQWEELPDDEFGNYDYLMGDDIEFRNPAVREELKRWGCWYAEATGIDGFRLDALKHITPTFFPEWIDHLRGCFKKDFSVIGEYWKQHVQTLHHYIEATAGKIQLFDVPLHYNLYHASQQGKDFDLSTIFDGTLVKENPHMAIPFVENHDTQPLQALESDIDYWFKPLAYAMILLREQGIPCVFYPAIYEAKYGENRNGEEIFVEMNRVELLELLLNARKDLAYGMQRDYIDHHAVIGWTREGIAEMENSGCAVLISNDTDAEKTMHIGAPHAQRVMIDATGSIEEQVILNDNGEGLFKVKGRNVSVWVFTK